MRAYNFWKLHGLGLVILLISGCGTSGVTIKEKFDESGKVVLERTTEATGDASVIMAGTEARKTEIEMVKQVKGMDSHAQVAAMARDMTSQVQPTKDLYNYKSNFARTVKEGFVALVTGGVIYKGFSTLDSAIANAGDKYTTGDITQWSSDDPIITGAEGVPAAGSASSGHNILNLGRNYVATDRSQLNRSVDKALTTPLDGYSNFDGSGNPSGIVIDDRNDGSGNSASLL